MSDFQMIQELLKMIAELSQQQPPTKTTKRAIAAKYKTIADISSTAALTIEVNLEK
jgi:hypothetical protein